MKNKFTKKELDWLEQFSSWTNAEIEKWWNEVQDCDAPRSTLK